MDLQSQLSIQVGALCEKEAWGFVQNLPRLCADGRPVPGAAAAGRRSTTASVFRGPLGGAGEKQLCDGSRKPWRCPAPCGPIAAGFEDACMNGLVQWATHVTMLLPILDATRQIELEKLRSPKGGPQVLGPSFMKNPKREIGHMQRTSAPLGAKPASGILPCTLKAHECPRL